MSTIKKVIMTGVIAGAAYELIEIGYCLGKGRMLGAIFSTGEMTEARITELKEWLQNENSYRAKIVNFAAKISEEEWNCREEGS